MNTTDTPRPMLNGHSADFRLIPDNLIGPDVRACTSRSDLEHDVRASLYPDGWYSQATYEATVEAVTDHFGSWVDYTHGVWEGTRIPAMLDTVVPADFWSIVKRLDADNTVGEA